MLCPVKWLTLFIAVLLLPACGALTLATTEKTMCAPEKNPNAIHALTMTNTGKLPLRPGRVAIYQDEAFLGHTDVDFVAS